MKRLRLTPEAELDLDEAHLWYQRQTPGLAANSLAAVNAGIASIQPIPRRVERPTKFDLVVTLRAAKALGVTMPPSVLARANHVIGD